MKARLRCKIASIQKDANYVQLEISETEGKVDTKMPPAQEIKITGILFLKPVIADQIKIGSTISIDLIIEDPQLL